jgi:sterol desaturase/sphingolipid hydroxylase (fatty acid hydroxylase superfamily)
MGNYHQQSQTLAELLDHNLIHLRDMGMVEILAYALVGVVAFAAIMLARRWGTFRFLIRAPAANARSQVHREVFNSTRSVILYNVVQLTTRIVALGFGYIITLHVHMPLWEEVLTFPLVMIVHDAYFYWTHRWMHQPAVFRFVHWEHHRSAAPTVFTAYSFSIPEAIVQGLFSVFYVAIFPATFLTLIVFQFLEILYNLTIHSGVDPWPRVLVTHRWFGWLAGSAYHDLHHRTARGNYGLYTRFWDRLCRTEHPDFVKIYEYIHSPQNDGQAYKLLSRRGASDAAAAPPELTPETAADVVGG